MSHQLRTPLNVVQGSTSLLLTGSQLPEQKELLKILQFSTSNLMATIENIIDFTSLDKGESTLTKEPFAVGELLNNIYRSFQFNADQKQINLLLDSDLVSKDLVISGDSLRLGQILFHLIENAINFTDVGQVLISLRSEQIALNQIKLTFNITDTGIGIPKEQVANALDPFADIVVENSRQHYGTIGLAIASHLVRLHGQEMLIESREGIGTNVSFAINFPIPIEQPIHVIAISEVSNLAGYRILIVDDEPLNILVMKRQLERWGIIVDTSVDGIQAIDKVRTEEYDLIPMDINMPRMDGFEASWRIRQMADPIKASIPILVVTGSVEAVAEGIKKSPYINDFVLKPAKPEELKIKIISLLKVVMPDDVK